MHYTESMEKSEKMPVKKFAFQFSPLMIAIFCLLLVLCTAGIALTTWQLTDFLSGGDITSVWEWMKYIIMYVVCALLFVLVLAMLIKSQYVVTEKELILQFGLIRSRYELKKIFSVRLFKGSNRLTVYFDDFKTNYMVVVVKESWYDAFVRALQERNERIEFDFTTAEEEENLKKK